MLHPELHLGCVPQQISGIKHGVRGEAWFDSMRTASEVALGGHEAVFQIKQYHSFVSQRIY